jgi:uncharacterized lipoprotein YddW (UPF0748 family)
LINNQYWKQYNLISAIAIELKSSLLFKIILSLLPSIFCVNSTIAAETVLGVVKSPDNRDRWSQIDRRLERVGVNYCTVDTVSWERELDFGNIQVLLLPDVETLNDRQTQSLKQWMQRGGKIIVTGMTGTSSSPEIRSQLKSIFGAYWGFPLTEASPLKLTDNTPVEWFGRSQLAQTIRGGAVLPTDDNSEVAAIWSQEDNAPAAVVTAKTTVLGWNWGIDRISPISLDAAWLEASLHRYGINIYPLTATETNTKPTSCRNSVASTEKPDALAAWRSRSLSNLPLLSRSLGGEEDSLPSRLGFYQEEPIADEQIQQMTGELQGLLGRFESSLLTVDAHHSDVDLSTTKTIDRLLSRQIKENKSTVSESISENKNAHQALAKARDNFKRFLSFIDQRSYTQARRQWIESRNVLWDNYPTNGQLAQSEIRAMWLDRGTIVKAQSESDLAVIFDRMAKAGINTVFFETINSGYTIYPSKIAPEQNPLTKGWDRLKAAVRLAHERGMELHAWVWTFAAVNQRHNTILNLPATYLGPVLSRHPDWVMSDRNGEAFDYNASKAFLDPANPEVRHYISSLLEEIASNYQVDGIQLDYIRYPFQNPTGTITYGYGKAAREQFQQLTGKDPIEMQLSDPLWSQWTGFRIKQIDNFVATVSQDLKQKHPKLILSTAVFPMPRQDRLTKIQQNWEEWIRQEWIDMLVPMTYALDTDRLQELANPVLEELNEGDALLLPGIRLLNVPNVVAVDQMQLLRGMPTEGFSLFAAENLTPSLERIFNRIQGSIHKKSLDPLPHREPFKAGLSRYRNLQKEWNFYISNDRLAIDEGILREWGEKADRLAIDLQQLADKPSTKHLRLTQLSLSAFRSEFPQWMQNTKSIDPYQAQAWQNRLTTLDRLLSYGERRVLHQTRTTSLN